MIWVAIALLSAIVVGLLLRPLWRSPTKAQGVRPEVAIYRDQLAEIEADLARGLIDREAAATARLEIERRLLALPDEAAPAMQPEPQRRRLAAVIGIVAVAGALGLYLELGRPDLPDAPIALRDLPPDPMTAGSVPPPDLVPDVAVALDAEIALLDAALDEDPSQRDAWAALGNRLIERGRYRDAIDAFEQAIAQGASDALTQSRLGVALTLLNGGVVTAEAEAAFRRALVAVPNDIAAAYWLAIRELQLGRADAALVQLVAIERALPADAPQRMSVSAVIDEIARGLGLDPQAARDRIATVAPNGDDPDSSDVPSVEGDQEVMIMAMVEGLAAKLEENPADLEGWRRLGRSWTVLGDMAKAEEAYARAAALAPDDVEVLLDHALAILATVPEDSAGPLPARLGERIATVLALMPDNPTALYLAGLDAARAGNGVAAREHWQHLLDVLPADAPQRAQIEAEIEALAAE